MQNRQFLLVRSLCLVGGGAAGLVAQGAAHAGDHYIFVTSSAYNGNLGGLSGADALCDQHAANGSLTLPLNRTWKALLSVGGVVDAKDRVIWSGPLYDVTGLLVTNDPGVWPWTSAGSSTLRSDENGSLSGASYVWTGTTSTGVAKGAEYDCNDWTDGTFNFNGWSGETGAFPSIYWVDSFNSTCDSAYSALFCVSGSEQEIIFADGFENAVKGA